MDRRVFGKMTRTKEGLGSVFGVGESYSDIKPGTGPQSQGPGLSAVFTTVTKTQAGNVSHLLIQHQKNDNIHWTWVLKREIIGSC